MTISSTAEAAEKLDLSAVRIRQLTIGGRLPAKKVERDYVIDEENLKLVMERRNGRPSNGSDKEFAED